jgi:F-type H+-transporting ATPase subunit gamma
MPLPAKTIRTKISSVKNIGKITRAMELVSVSKMKKAVDQATHSREYAARALEILENLSRHRTLRHPLLRQGMGDKVLLVVVSSNKGLCGGYNANVIKTAVKFAKELKDESCTIVAVGRYSERASRVMKADLVASFVDIGDEPSWRDTRAVANLATEEFLKGAYTRVVLVYTRYESALSYAPVVQNLLPIRKSVVAEFQDTVGSVKNPEPGVVRESMSEYMFEPSEQELLDATLPRLVESQVYQALLEARASEHSARMFAMKNASDNAKTLVEDLTLSYNQVRQSAITQEISEIAAGADAL